MATCTTCGRTLGYDCDCSPLFNCPMCKADVFASQYNGQQDDDGAPICSECDQMKTMPTKPEVTLDPDADTEQLKKYRFAYEQIQKCGLRDFLDWLRERYVFAVQLADDDDRRAWNGDLARVPFDGEQIFADYFEIDLHAVERARQRLIDQISQAQDSSETGT